MRTAKAKGMETVAVYTDADADAPHRHVADQAVRIGEGPAGASYLSIERLLDAAGQTGADAVHPGYGFLSESAELARKCERLAAGRRWMVSGTPLYDKISDLQGELYFLRVSPFGAGHEDGFWRHVIGDPWEARQESSLDALHVLLRGVMMRHSKSQTHVGHSVSIPGPLACPLPCCPSAANPEIRGSRLA